MGLEYGAFSDFLSCLPGSEGFEGEEAEKRAFLSCLPGSEDI